MENKEFVNISNKIFSFLETEYKFKRLKPTKSCGVISISYINATTGIKVNYGDREDLFSLVMYKLEDGKMIYGGNKSYWLWSLIALKAPEKDAELERQVTELRKKLTDDGIINHLKYNAEMLKQYGGDILNGDFTMFPAFQKICQERVAPYIKEAYKNLTPEQRKILGY